METNPLLIISGTPGHTLHSCEASCCWCSGAIGYYTSTQNNILGTSPRTNLQRGQERWETRPQFFPSLEVKWKTTRACLAYTGNGETWITRARKRKGNSTGGRKGKVWTSLVLVSTHNCWLAIIIPLTLSTDGYGGLPIKYALTYLAGANPFTSSLSSWRTVFLLPNHATKLFFWWYFMDRINVVCTDKAASGYCWFCQW